MPDSVRLTVRGFLGRTLKFEQHIDTKIEKLDQLLPSLALEHATAMGEGTLDMIEIEFLDEPDINERFFRLAGEALMIAFRDFRESLDKEEVDKSDYNPDA